MKLKSGVLGALVLLFSWETQANDDYQRIVRAMKLVERVVAVTYLTSGVAFQCVEDCEIKLKKLGIALQSGIYAVISKSAETSETVEFTIVITSPGTDHGWGRSIITLRKLRPACPIEQTPPTDT